MKNKRIAILTMDSLEDFFAYDYMLDKPFAEKGWKTEHISWRKPNVDWDQFAVVIVRSPWDYQQDPRGFITCLQAIEASSAVLENPYSLMLWNIEKTYLRDLESHGVPIVPTLWLEQYAPDMLDLAKERFAAKELIVKPVVSANADDTFRIHSQEIDAYDIQLQDTFCQRALMIQPFLPAILDPGEYSLFYFDHNYSHAILKTPKSEDFRVQEEHGGQLASIEPTAEMFAVAEKTLSALPEKALYARIDLIHTGEQFAVMEVELIEPSLYFNMDESSAQRFVEVFCNKYPN